MTFLNMINDIKVLQANYENSNTPIAQIALKAKVDQLASELQIFCTSNSVIIPPAAPVNECPTTPPPILHPEGIPLNRIQAWILQIMTPN